VTLVSKDPFVPPNISPNYWGIASDRDTLVTAMKRARKIMRLGQLGQQIGRELLPGEEVVDDEDLARYIMCGSRKVWGTDSRQFKRQVADSPSTGHSGMQNKTPHLRKSSNVEIQSKKKKKVSGLANSQPISEEYCGDVPTAAHLAGSCKMGDLSADSSNVVNFHLQLHGVQGVRVIDASIMPTLPSGNTHATCVVIGEMGAKFILQDHQIEHRAFHPSESDVHKKKKTNMHRTHSHNLNDGIKSERDGNANHLPLRTAQISHSITRFDSSITSFSDVSSDSLFHHLFSMITSAFKSWYFVLFCWSLFMFLLGMVVILGWTRSFRRPLPPCLRFFFPRQCCAWFMPCLYVTESQTSRNVQYGGQISDHIAAAFHQSYQSSSVACNNMQSVEFFDNYYDPAQVVAVTSGENCISNINISKSNLNRIDSFHLCDDNNLLLMSPGKDDDVALGRFTPDALSLPQSSFSNSSVRSFTLQHEPNTKSYGAFDETLQRS
jgi:hypothetical protein